MNKRIQNAIIQSFVFYMLVFIALIAVFFFLVMPGLSDASQKKSELNELITEKARIQQEGLDFWEFKSLYKEYSKEKNPYVTNILKTLDWGFYSEHLTNTGSEKYTDFLHVKKQETLEKKDSEEFQDIEATIQSILPLYSLDTWPESSFNDHDFVKYIESILFTFNLQTDDNLGIGDIVPFDDGTTQSEKKKQISSDNSIFYIPLQLELTGQKKDILDFIHFVENVGTISIEDNTLQVHEDKVIQKSLEGQRNSPTYNIYRNQLIEIESISMRDYIDTSSELTTGDFITFIKSTQGRERFNINISLRFYIAGIPWYQVEKFISDTLDTQVELKKSVSQSISANKKKSQSISSSDALFALTTINSLLDIVDKLGEDMKEIKKLLVKDPSRIDVLYNDALEVSKDLQRVEEILETNQQIIDTISK